MRRPSIKALMPDFGGRVSRRDLALSPAVWIVVWGTFALFAVATLVLVLASDEFHEDRLLALSGSLAVIALVMSRMPPPEPDRARTHALLSLTYIGPMFAMIALAPQGSAVAITTAFAAPLTSVWVVARRQIAGHLTAATCALFLPSALGLVDQATFFTCLCIAVVMWALAVTCVAVLEAAERQGVELAHLGRRDPLTGAGNRRLLEEELALELGRQQLGHHRPFTLLTFDLNGFKALNDTVGHAAGDALLKAMADVLMRTAREHDTVVRQGGDEFCMLLPATTERDASALAELIRARLQGVRAFGSGISTGIGSATCPTDGTDAATLLATADARLMADKAAAPQRDASDWRHEVPETAPRPGSEVDATAGADGEAPAWTIDGVSRRHLESLRSTWRAAGASAVLYALLGLSILVFAPELGRPGLAFVAVLPAILAIVLLFGNPPRMDTAWNHLYVTMPYVLPAMFAMVTRPGAIALGLSMFVGPLAAVRVVQRRQVVAHLAAATLIFGAVLVLRHDEVATVTSLIIVISNLWVLGFCCVLILEASEAQGGELARLVRRDPLTGLGNRRRLREHLDEALAVHAASGKPLTLLVLDLNGFKQLNDTLGHAAGDELLQRVADALRVIAAAPAEAMRQGGDEFAVVLPDTTADEARAVIAAINRTLGNIDDHGVRVTTGLGMATFPDDGVGVDALLDRADHRLREHKYGEGVPERISEIQVDRPERAERHRR